MSIKLFVNGHTNTGWEHLQIFRNNPTQRIKLGASSQIQGEKGLKSTTFHSANTEKG